MKTSDRKSTDSSDATKSEQFENRTTPEKGGLPESETQSIIEPGKVWEPKDTQNPDKGPPSTIPPPYEPGSPKE